jgi:hypothetical protein
MVSKETQEISSYTVTIHEVEHTLVDTPGFEDTNRSDTEILEMLVNWLATSYRAGQRLRGILYLYRIDETRMKGSSLRNLNMFKQLCGEDFYKYLTLGTTCWSLVDYSNGVSRETQLTNTMSFWKAMIDKGATRVRVPDSAYEARQLVYRIAKRGGSAPLQAQKEVVDRGLSFRELQVTQVVKQELELEEAERARAAAKMYQLMVNRLEMLAIQAEQERRLIETEEQARRNRMQHYLDITNYCRLTTPFGYCDNSGCTNKLKRFRYVFRKYSADVLVR